MEEQNKSQDNSQSIIKIKGRIIVAEDELHNMTVIQSKLKQLDILDSCEFVYNGEEAVIKFSELTQAGIKVSYLLTDF